MLFPIISGQVAISNIAFENMFFAKKQLITGAISPPGKGIARPPGIAITV
jgi:hypothetical protein